jgi:hypothetical protein
MELLEERQREREREGDSYMRIAMGIYLAKIQKFPIVQK